MAINFGCPKKAKKACGRQIGVEKYWIKKLLLWQMKPLDLNICGRYGRKLAHKANYQIFRLLIIVQQGIVLSCQVLGENEKPKNLIELLEKVDSSLAFTGVKDFDSDKVPSLGPSEPPNCWALPAEEIVWSEVELDGRWLEVDLNEMAIQGNGVKETIKSLSDISKEKFTEYAETHFIHMNEWVLEEDPSRWCIRVLAANSMYRICETILSDTAYDRSQRLFEKLSLMICTLFATCFTNLQHVISKQCHQSGIEEREQNIRNAVLLFGKTEGIIRILDKKKIQESNPGQLVHIDDWHLLCKKMDTISSIRSTDNDLVMQHMANVSQNETQKEYRPKVSNSKKGNILITRVYFVEGLGHNLFSVGQFRDSDLEVAFRRNACFVRNLEGVDLLKGDRSTNLYTINLHEMASASPICLMARASSTKSWLWHQRLSHLNFDTINDLARNDLVAGLPKFKYHKEHLCPSCEQGKSKRASHPPKPVPNSRKGLHLLHMDLCGPMRIGSINGKRSKPGLQCVTSGQISSGLDLTYAPSTTTTQQPTEVELDLLFEAMYDDYFGGQPSVRKGVRK
nr:ribonuclease H-like domain-containing protein [Tanacetum cinerariifolium]